MDPVRMVDEAVKWVDAHYDAYVMIEAMCVNDYMHGIMPRVKHHVEIARGSGISLKNNHSAFIARLIEHRRGIPCVKSASAVDAVLTEAFWARYDEREQRR